MNVLREAIEHATLGWIKPELDATLKQVQQEIEAYADDGADPARMRVVSALLHQVQGSLKMVELYAPAMVAGEMQSVADAIAEGRVTDTDEASSALMRGAVQLPDYLERLQGGHRDIPIVLMPLLNELRASHGMKPISETALFNPDFGREIPPLSNAAGGDSRGLIEGVSREVAAWRNGNGFDAGNLHDALIGLANFDNPPEARRLFWVGAELAAALRDGAIAETTGIRDAFSNMEREGRRVFEESAMGPAPASSLLEPTRQLLFQVSADRSDHPALQRLRETFGLEQAAAPGDQELAHAHASVSGRNRALLDSVSAAIKEDVLRIKDALDIHLRTGSADFAVLKPQAEALGRVSDTLGMLGLGLARDVIAEQRDVVGAIANGRQPMSESALLDVAGALLYVDASLDDQVARLGDEASQVPTRDVDGLGAAEAQQLLNALTREAIANFGDARQGFVAFVETGWDHGQLVEIPRLLDEVGGALRMLGLSQVSDYLVGISRYTQIELLDRKRVPGGQQLDTLADALSSVEYYLEALRDQRGSRDEILAITRHSLEALRYWPLPQSAEVTETPFLDNEFEDAYQDLLDEAETLPSGAAVVQANQHQADANQQAPDVVSDTVFTEPAPTIEAPVAAELDEVESVVDESISAPQTLSVSEGGFDIANDDIDDEIREIFLEEFSEEIGNLGALIPAWRQAPHEVEHLRPIRRVFHTLKGSGRLVGAKLLGEFSWKIESMLNRVLDGSRAATPAVVDVVEHAHSALPYLHGALLGVPVGDVDLAGLEAIADRVAAGEEVTYVPTTLSQESAAESEVAAQPEATDDRVDVQVDDVLLEILGVEIAGHLDTVDRWLADDEVQTRIPDRDLLRAVHTMNGAFAMAEVPEITDAIAPAETWIKRLIVANQPLDAAGVAALARLTQQIRSTVTGLQSAPQRVPTQQALASEFVVLRDAWPEATTDALMSKPEILDVSASDLEAERIEAERVEAERAEAERAEAERAEAERAEAERVEAERVEAERVEAEEAAEYARLEAQYAEEARLKLESERAPPAEHATSLEAERLEAERVEAERLEAERVEAERLEAERVEAERVEAERLEAERVEAERLEAERVEAERLEAERLEAERAEAERLAELRRQEHLDLLRLEAERLDAERLAREQAALDVDDEIGPAEPLDIAGLDEDLLDIFIEEGRDLLDHSDGLSARLRADPSDRDALTALQRDLHTLKGGARMAGLMTMGDLGHALESLLESVAEGRLALADDDIPLIENSLDRLHAMLGRVARRRAIHPAEALVASLMKRVRGDSPQPAVQPAVAPAPTIKLAELSAPIQRADEQAEPGARGSQEMVRIRADLLDRLVNYAGEVAIYRSRLEQQLGAFRGAMSEMEQTNTRLRDQLRRLDIETEAQIIARYQREQETTNPTFDPLELDRFSTLQQLSRALGESANDMSSLQGSLEDLTRQYETLLLQQSRVSTELQEGLMRTRMVPVESVLPRLRRVVRQASGDAGKSAQFVLEGAHGELDRNVLDRMLGPLEHLLRNAVAHGIEKPEARGQAGKPDVGEVRLNVRQEGSEVVLVVSDDGAGLDREAIRQRAEERGMVQPETVLSDAQIDNLILESGFSTSSEVSQLAGRGVGMDVVNNEVRQIGGSLEIASTRGQGSRFTLHLPQTLAVTQAVFVRIGDNIFAVPVASVRGVSRVNRDLYDGDEYIHQYGDESYLIHDLGVLLGQAPAKAEGQLQIPVLLVRSGDLRVAVGVDQILGNREIVVKPTGPQMASIPGVFGATVMGDGQVRIILDIAPLARRWASQPQVEDEEPRPAVQNNVVPLVMVVDDSITMRKVTGRVLGRQGFEVMTAKDGIDALEQMEERVPDLMLLDIEMPRMDGYELAAEMKHNPRLRQVPIVMITSRTGDKHRQRAFDLGVNRYLGKPYQETELLRNVSELLGLGREHG